MYDILFVITNKNVAYMSHYFQLPIALLTDDWWGDLVYKELQLTGFELYIDSRDHVSIYLLSTNKFNGFF